MTRGGPHVTRGGGTYVTRGKKGPHVTRGGGSVVTRGVHLGPSIRVSGGGKLFAEVVRRPPSLRELKCRRVLRDVREIVRDYAVTVGVVCH